MSLNHFFERFGCEGSRDRWDLKGDVGLREGFKRWAWACLQADGKIQRREPLLTRGGSREEGQEEGSPCTLAHRKGQMHRWRGIW